MQAPLADIVWPEIPTTIHALPGTLSDIQLLGITSSGTIHVIELTATDSGKIQKDWTSVPDAFGTGARFLPGWNEKGGIGVASKRKDWRVEMIQP